MALLDYGAGNLASVARALDHLGVSYEVVSDGEALQGAERLILPGVGAFGSAMEELARTHLDSAVRRSVSEGIPFLGVCLGLQLLFDSSDESPGVAGLGIAVGTNRRFTGGVRVPHIGWNETRLVADSPLFEGIPEGTYFYYVHSFHAVPERETDIAATADYEDPFCAAVSFDNVHAVQFHPEKSQDAGLTLLENFVRKC